MDRTELGKRIKEARLAKKLTQAEVVGTFITRNMLSQIESGNALPSVKTLQYLCEKLEIPMSTFETEDGTAQAEKNPYLKLRDAFAQERYEEIVSCEECENYGDELAALKARSLLALAAKADKQDVVSLQQAADRARAAAELAGRGIYANDSVRSEAQLLFNSLAQQLSDYYKSMIDTEFAQTLGEKD